MRKVMAARAKGPGRETRRAQTLRARRTDSVIALKVAARCAKSATMASTAVADALLLLRTRLAI